MTAGQPFVTFSQNAAPRLRLLCFSYAGAGANVFAPWKDLLGTDIDLIACQLPGRESRFRDPPFQRMSDALDELEPALAPLIDQPYAMFGHSMGALLAFELTRRIEAAGLRRPERLIVSGRRAPDLPSEPIHFADQCDEEFVGELRRMGGTPQELLDNPDILAALLPMIRADFRVCESYTYAPGAKLATPITAYGAHGDCDVGLEGVKGWSRFSIRPFTHRMFGGSHFFLNEDRGALIRCMLKDLAHAPRRVGTTASSSQRPTVTL